MKRFRLAIHFLNGTFTIVSNKPCPNIGLDIQQLGILMERPSEVGHVNLVAIAVEPILKWITCPTASYRSSNAQLPTVQHSRGVAGIFVWQARSWVLCPADSITVGRVFFQTYVVCYFYCFSGWNGHWAGYLAVAGLNIPAQISDRISPFGV